MWSAAGPKYTQNFFFFFFFLDAAGVSFSKVSLLPVHLSAGNFTPATPCAKSARQLFQSPPSVLWRSVDDHEIGEHRGFAHRLVHAQIACDSPASREITRKVI